MIFRIAIENQVTAFEILLRLKKKAMKMWKSVIFNGKNGRLYGGSLCSIFGNSAFDFAHFTSIDIRKTVYFIFFLCALWFSFSFNVNN